MIDELVANNIEPIVTMYHWDMPQYIQDLGGLTNPLFVEYFKTFADVLYTNFGSRVRSLVCWHKIPKHSQFIPGQTMDYF